MIDTQTYCFELNVKEVCSRMIVTAICMRHESRDKENREWEKRGSCWFLKSLFTCITQRMIKTFVIQSQNLSSQRLMTIDIEIQLMLNKAPEDGEKAYEWPLTRDCRGSLDSIKNRERRGWTTGNSQSFPTFFANESLAHSKKDNVQMHSFLFGLTLSSWINGSSSFMFHLFFST